jgi:transcriptional regulator with XRE-family HTH domain
MSATEANRLGDYLRSRRARLDPAAFGFASSRRRTPGLRREEVAQRANISPTWYTWLEQGRGGNASSDVLDRIARALTLTEVEREHLFLLGLGRSPGARPGNGDAHTPRLQRLLDALPYSPAIIRTATWDVIAWNRAFASVMTDYSKVPPDQRNVLRRMFLDPRTRAMQLDWEGVARAVVASFRIDAARAGADADVLPMVDELCRLSPEFAAMWRDNDVQAHGSGMKRLRHPVVGPLALEYSSFAVETRPDLSLVVYNPAQACDRVAIGKLMDDNDDKEPGGRDHV